VTHAADHRKEEWMQQLERSLLKKKHNSNEKSSTKHLQSENLKNMYKTIDENIKTHQEILLKRKADQQSDLRAAYDRQIQSKSQFPTSKPNHKLLDPTPKPLRPSLTRNLLDDLQTDKFRTQKHLEQHQSLSNSQQNLPQNMVKNSELQNFASKSLETEALGQILTGKSKKIMDMYGRISLGNLLPPRKLPNSDYLEKTVKCGILRGRLEEQMMQRDMVKEMEEKGRYCPENHLRAQEHMFDEAAVIDFGGLNRAFHGSAGEPGRGGSFVLKGSQSLDPRAFGGSSKYDFRVQNRPYCDVGPAPDCETVESMKPSKGDRYFLQRNCIEDIQKGFYLNKGVVNGRLEVEDMYRDIKKKYGNHAGVYNIITGC
jgi:hypothetical protein